MIRVEGKSSKDISINKEQFNTIKNLYAIDRKLAAHYITQLNKELANAKI